MKLNSLKRFLMTAVVVMLAALLAISFMLAFSALMDFSSDRENDIPLIPHAG